MPQVVTWIPDYAKIPKEIFGGHFTWIDNSLVPGWDGKHTSLYKFHDGTWATDATHMLGFSREIIHTLEHGPNWLVGHAFRLVGKKYKLSGTDLFFDPAQLIEWAKEAEELLKPADVTVGQWGDKSLDDWPAAITRDIEECNRRAGGAHPSIEHHRQAVGDVAFHVSKCNHGNSVHHPEYPKK